MTKGGSAETEELEQLLRRLQEAHESLLEVLKGGDQERFAEQDGGDSVKAIVERTSDDVNLYYGRLAARAMSLPQPPCVQRADFSSLREAVAALQVAHRQGKQVAHREGQVGVEAELLRHVADVARVGVRVVVAAMKLDPAAVGHFFQDGAQQRRLA